MTKKKVEDMVLDNPEEAPIEEEVVVEEAPVEEEEAPKVKGKSVSVFNGPDFIREYSEGVHGKGFADLAKQFATKKGYSLK